MIAAITLPINNLFLHTGYTGDPDSDEGCYDHTVGPDRVTISPRDGCLVKNETYSVGQKWNDGCDYTCTCSLKLEILCQVRFIIITYGDLAAHHRIFWRKNEFPIFHESLDQLD